MPAAKAVAAKVANAAAKAAASAVRKEGRPAKVVPVSPALKKFLGVDEADRTETLKVVWAYIKDKQLQNPDKRREIVCDETLKLVFRKDRLDLNEVFGLLNSHFPKKGTKKS